MRTAWRILGTRLCIRYALWASQPADREAFLRLFDDFASPRTGYGLDPRLVHEWETGGIYISEGLVHRIDTQVAGTTLVYALATLLQQQCLSAPSVRKVVGPICEQTGSDRSWKLPSVPGAARGATTPYAWDDSASLVSRGDFHGFLAILALLRESVATRDSRTSQYARDLYAILPSVCRISWVRQDTDLLLQCIEGMMVGLRWVPALLITIDWYAFRDQMIDPSPWEDVPPWIVGCTGYANRPVPLLEDIVPLQPYASHRNPERSAALKVFQSIVGACPSPPQAEHQKPESSAPSVRRPRASKR